MAGFGVLAMFLLAFISFNKIFHDADGAIPRKLQTEINEINMYGPYIGLVIPDAYEMNPLLQSPSFISHKTMPYIDFAGRRFRFGTIERKKVIIILTGMGMVNGGISSQLLLSLFRIQGVIFYGIAGNANPSLNIGDVAIPQYWAHTALWNWQRYGDGPGNELALEVNGEYTRKIGYLKFSDYSTVNESKTSCGNLLNSIWYQPEEVYPVDGTPESREHAFWVPVDSSYFAISKKLEDQPSPAQPNPCSGLQLDNKRGNHLRRAFGTAVAMEAEKWKRTALLVIDMQNDFIKGPMHVAGGKAIVPSVIQAVDVARQRGILVVWVVREHDSFGRDVELFRRHLYGDGKEKPATKGTYGAELVDGLIIREGDYKLVKTRFSAFFATNLQSLLQGAGIKSVVVVGVQTPNCIRQTVFDAVSLDYQPVTVIIDATAAATPLVHDANIFDMKNIGVETPTLQEWCS